MSAFSMSMFLKELDKKFSEFVVEQSAPHSYEAVNENPRVFCSTGKSPAEALYNMADELAINNIEFWSAASTNFDDEGTCYLTIYV